MAVLIVHVLPVLEYPLGPDQVRLPVPVAVRLNACPTHTGPLFAAETIGLGLNVIFTGIEEEEQPNADETVTEYEPEPYIVIL